MIEQIKLALINESGDCVPIETENNSRLEIKLETTIADLFTRICFRNNSIKDAEIKTAEKFHLAKTLKNYLEEMKDGMD